MTLLSWKEFIAARESSPATRSKTASALDLGPDVADVFGHATPPPWQAERLLKKLSKNKKKDGDDEKDNQSIEEKADMRPDYGFDRLVRKAMSASKEIDGEIEKAEKESNRLDKKKKDQEKADANKTSADKHTGGNTSCKKCGKYHDADELEAIEQPEQPKRSDKQVQTKVAKKTKTPQRVSDEKEKEKDKDKIMEEQTWLRLLGNTSFDPH